MTEYVFESDSGGTDFTEANQLKLRCSHLEEMNEQLSSSFNELQIKYRSSMKENETLLESEKIIFSLRNQLQSAKKEIVCQRQEIDTLRDQNTSVNTEMDVLKDKLFKERADLTQTIRNQTQKAFELQSMHDIAKKELAEMKKRVDSLMESKKKAKEEIQTLQDDKRELSMRVKTLEAERDAVALENLNLKRELEALQMNNDSKIVSNKISGAEVEDLKDQVRELNVALTLIEGSMHAQSEEIEKYANERTKLVELLQKHNSLTFPPNLEKIGVPIHKKRLTTFNFNQNVFVEALRLDFDDQLRQKLQILLHEDKIELQDRIQSVLDELSREYKAKDDFIRQQSQTIDKIETEKLRMSKELEQIKQITSILANDWMNIEKNESKLEVLAFTNPTEQLQALLLSAFSQLSPTPPEMQDFHGEKEKILLKELSGIPPGIQNFISLLLLSNIRFRKQFDEVSQQLLDKKELESAMDATGCNKYSEIAKHLLENRKEMKKSTKEIKILTDQLEKYRSKTYASVSTQAQKLIRHMDKVVQIENLIEFNRKDSENVDEKLIQKVNIESHISKIREGIEKEVQERFETLFNQKLESERSKRTQIQADFDDVVESLKALQLTLRMHQEQAKRDIRAERKASRLEIEQMSEAYAKSKLKYEEALSLITNDLQEAKKRIEYLSSEIEQREAQLASLKSENRRILLEYRTLDRQFLNLKSSSERETCTLKTEHAAAIMNLETHFQQQFHAIHTQLMVEKQAIIDQISSALGPIYGFDTFELDETLISSLIQKVVQDIQKLRNSNKRQAVA